ncbi:hypothetical protein [Acidisoma cladoniae]|jgi:hypothetical protein|uniref:hypothetical protein n=1 Tax=Acidisoma cladoniae TaxID=3040935 RepID=UPI002549D51A|nr:hypothetical protein [Acidisoma sp. PAMC 29798]
MSASQVTVPGSTTAFNYTPPANSNVFVPFGSSGTITGGAGATTIHGAGSTNLTFIGGTAPATVYGGQNSTLIGGSAPSLLVGGVNAVIQAAAGSGNSTLIAGTGNSTLGDASATDKAGNEFSVNPFATASTLTTINLDAGANTVLGAGAGDTTVNGGSGADIYEFFAGHGGGTETITQFGAGSTFAFDPGLGAKPITSENFAGGTDTITLTDGTTIHIEGVTGKIFGS